MAVQEARMLNYSIVLRGADWYEEKDRYHAQNHYITIFLGGSSPISMLRLSRSMLSVWVVCCVACEMSSRRVFISAALSRLLSGEFQDPPHLHYDGKLGQF